MLLPLEQRANLYGGLGAAGMRAQFLARFSRLLLSCESFDSFVAVAQGCLCLVYDSADAVAAGFPADRHAEADRRRKEDRKRMCSEAPGR
jgi:hypothetical protein